MTDLQRHGEWAHGKVTIVPGLMFENCSHGYSAPTIETGAPVKPEVLDNPNDPRGRTNVQIAADALMANCDGEMVRYDDEGTCEWLWDGERVRGPRACMCLDYAEQVVAALEAVGRLS